ncbi:MAG: hypothetical protein J3K34DRAFT_514163, partial [Monoraphidium minutum]
MAAAVCSITARTASGSGHSFRSLFFSIGGVLRGERRNIGIEFILRRPRQRWRRPSSNFRRPVVGARRSAAGLSPGGAAAEAPRRRRNMRHCAPCSSGISSGMVSARRRRPGLLAAASKRAHSEYACVGRAHARGMVKAGHRPPSSSAARLVHSRDSRNAARRSISGAGVKSAHKGGSGGASKAACCCSSGAAAMTTAHG